MFFFVRAEFGVQLSGFPGSPRERCHVSIPGEMTEEDPKGPPATFLTCAGETMVQSLHAGGATGGGGQGYGEA